MTLITKLTRWCAARAIDAAERVHTKAYEIKSRCDDRLVHAQLHDLFEQHGVHNIRWVDIPLTDTYADPADLSQPFANADAFHNHYYAPSPVSPINPVYHAGPASPPTDDIIVWFDNGYDEDEGDY